MNDQTLKPQHVTLEGLLKDIKPSDLVLTEDDKTWLESTKGREWPNPSTEPTPSED